MTYIRRALIVCVFFSICSISSAKVPLQLSEQARVSLLTCEPADVVYAKFGHTGLRIEDPATGIDYTFHWGIFYFDSPNFIMRFMLGKTDYEMGVFPTSFFLMEYIERGSSVYSQTINLNQEQKNDLWEKLWTNYEPKNRIYRYNFVYDNCATRPYNMLLQCYGTNIETDYRDDYTTYRTVINEHVELSSWLNLGIQVIIGSAADKPIGTKEVLAFPLHTMEAIQKCHTTIDGIREPIAEAIKTVFYAPTVSKSKTMEMLSLLLQIFLPLSIAAFLLVYYATKHRRHFCPYITPVLYIAYGIIGLLIMFLWFLSSHPLVDNNFNLLWFNPIGLILAPFLFVHGFHRFKLYTSTILMMSSLAYLFAIIFGLQAPTVPLMAWWMLNITLNTVTVATYKKTFHNLSQARKR